MPVLPSYTNQSIAAKTFRSKFLFFSVCRNWLVYIVFGYLQFWSQYFETFWVLNFFFHHKWNEPWLLVINMVYTSCPTNWRTTYDLDFEKSGKIRKISKLHRIIARVCLKYFVHDYIRQQPLKPAKSRHRIRAPAWPTRQWARALAWPTRQTARTSTPEPHVPTRQ